MSCSLAFGLVGCSSLLALGCACRRGHRSRAHLTLPEPRHALDHRFDMIDGDQRRAFELAGVSLCRGHHRKSLWSKRGGIVPAPAAGVIVDDAIRRGELVGRVRETRDKRDRSPPTRPATTAAREANKDGGVLEPAPALLCGHLGGRRIGALCRRAGGNRRPRPPPWRPKRPEQKSPKRPPGREQQKPPLHLGQREPTSTR